MDDMDMNKAEQKTLWQKILCGSGSKQDQRNQIHFVIWTFLWALSLVAVTWGLKSDYDFPYRLDWLLAIVPTLLGIAVLISYIRFLRETDEMLRKIQLEGLAIGFGVGVLFTAGYQLFETVGAPAIDSHDTVAIMMFAWVFGQLLAMRRYQ